MDKTEYLNKIHKTELTILDAILDICDKNNIVYFLAGGSALGAVRHHGYIPWDDDIDIVMPRKHYNKFLILAQKELPPVFFVQTQDTDKNYVSIFSKIRMNNTLFEEKALANISMHKGIFVDVFPLDDSKKNNSFIAFQYSVANKINHIMKIKRKIEGGKKINVFLSKIVPMFMLKGFQHFFLTIQNSQKSNYFINFGSQYGIIKQTMPKSVYLPAKLIEFEGRMCCVPGNPDKYLTSIFGSDYMTLPPVEKRVTHTPLRVEFEDGIIINFEG